MTALPYKKWTEDDIKNRNISIEGEYAFKIKEANLKDTKPKLDNHGQQKPTSKMLEVKMEFHDGNGVVKNLTDWIVFTDGMDWKLRHLARTCGLLELYDNDALDSNHLIGKCGVLLLGIREGEYKGEKQKQNFIKDYVDAKPVTKGADFIDDDIPL